MSLKLKMPVGVSGFFRKVEVLSATGEVLRSFDGFPNLITDAGLNRLASNQSYPDTAYNWCVVGTGSAEPEPTDNQLQNQIASSSSFSFSNSTNVPGGYCEVSQTWTFDIGAVVGNVSELGTGWGAGINQLFSRALILDALGNPTTIPVQADEQLRVTWAHRRYWPTADITGTVVNEGNKGGEFDYTIRASLVSLWQAGSNRAQIAIATNFSTVASAGANRFFYGETTLGGIDDQPTSTGGVYGLGSTTNRTTDGPSTSADLALALNQGNNAAGIGGMVFSASHSSGTGPGSLHSFQVKFDPPIMKTAQDLLEIGVTISWGRA